VSEMCSDGNSYSVDCQCPRATCDCTRTGLPLVQSVSYPGCPTCTQLGNLFALCGFPQ
jgi:hypothetical protein